MQIFGVNHSSANAHMLLPLTECAMDEKWMRHMVHSAVTRQVNFVFHLPACGRATEHTNAPSTRRNNPKFEYGIRDIPTFRSLSPQERKIAHPCPCKKNGFGSVLRSEDTSINLQNRQHSHTCPSLLSQRMQSHKLPEGVNFGQRVLKTNQQVRKCIPVAVGSGKPRAPHAPCVPNSWFDLHNCTKTHQTNHYGPSWK
jgi:hypothetical protein